MRRSLFICLAILLFTAGTIADASAATRRSATRSRTSHSQAATGGPYCNVERRCAFLVVDAASGTVLTADDPDKQVYPASLTKMMTIYLLIEALESGKVRLSDRVFISSNAAIQPAMKIGFSSGDTATIEDLLEAVTVKSANDAAVAIAETLGGTESAFARRMTQKAHQLGMNRTNFANASGLPDDRQLTTARDMVTLAQHLLNDFPRYRRYFGLTSARVAGRNIEGHNHLLARGEIEGGKTGYIRDSGYNLVAWAERNGRILIGAVFGGRTYATRDAKMLEVLRSASSIANRQQLPNSDTQVAAARTGGWTNPVPGRKPGDDGIGNMIDQTEVDTLTSTPPLPASPLPPNVVEVPASALSYSAPTFGNSWAIQVGAYRDAGQAQQALDKATRELPAVLGAAYPRTLATATNVGQLHRAQLIGLDERQAKAACAVLSRKGMQCLPMPPTG